MRSLEVGTAEVGLPQVRSPKVGTAEVGTADIGMVKVGIDEVGTDKVGTAEIGADEVGTAEIGIDEVGAQEIGIAEVRPVEVGIEEVGTAEIGTVEVGIKEVGTAEVSTAEVGMAEVQPGFNFRNTGKPRKDIRTRFVCQQCCYNYLKEFLAFVSIPPHQQFFYCQWHVYRPSVTSLQLETVLPAQIRYVFERLLIDAENLVVFTGRRLI
jgi:transposase-like protein